MLKKIVGNTFIYGLAPYVASFANLLLLPIITKDLTELDYGISGTITAYTGALSAFGSLGLTVILTNSFFKHTTHFKWIWRQIYGFLSIWNIIYSSILALILILLMPRSVGENKYLVVFLNTLPIILFGQTNTIATLYFTLQKRASQIGIRAAIFGLLAVFLNYIFIAKLKLGYMGWFWTSCIINVLTSATYWYSLNVVEGISPILNFKKKTILRGLKISLPMIPNYYSYYLLEGSERLIMDRLKVPTARIGEYNMAATFSNYAGNFAYASNNAVVPFLLDFIKNKEYIKARNLIYKWSIILLFCTFTGCLWSKEIFTMLIKNDVLNKTYPLAIVLIMAYNFRPVFIGAYQYMVYMEKTKYLWKVSFIAGIICVGTNLILIPVFNFKVAIFSLFFAFLYIGIALYFSKDYKGIKTVDYHPIKWTFIIVALTCIVYLLRDANLFLKIILTFINVLSIVIYFGSSYKKIIFKKIKSFKVN